MRCLTIDECKSWRVVCSRRRNWKRQITCQTPLKRLTWFTRELLEHLTPFEDALLIVDQVVFDDPPVLLELRGAAGEDRPGHESPGHLFENEPQTLRTALEAVLSGWVDFRVLFSPPGCAILADHDEYTTVFCISPGIIAGLRRAFEQGGLELPAYTAKSP